MTEIHTPWNQNFGDQIATISLLTHKALYTRRPVFLSHWQNDTDLKQVQSDILEILDTGFSAPLLVNEKGNTPLSGYDVWAATPVPAKPLFRWDRDVSHGYIAYQFDGVSTPELKNPPEHDVNGLLDFFSEKFLPVLPVGKPMTPAMCATTLSHAKFFLGVDSGMSHLAYAVGVPVFLLQYQLPVVTCHRGKPHTVCEGAGDAVIKMQRWLDYLFTIGHPDGVRSGMSR